MSDSEVTLDEVLDVLKTALKSGHDAVSDKTETTDFKRGYLSGLEGAMIAIDSVRNDLKNIL